MLVMVLLQQNPSMQTSREHAHAREKGAADSGQRRLHFVWSDKAA